MYILDTVREDVKQLLVERSFGSDCQDTVMMHLLFKNFRCKNNHPTGLRLSYIGESILKKYFESYTYEHQVLLNNKLLYLLDKKMTWPYYVSNSKIVFFGESDASWYKLSNNNLNSFLEYL